MDEQMIASLLGNSRFNPGMMRGFMGRRPGLSNMANNPMAAIRKPMPDIMSIIKQNPQAITSLLGNSGVGGSGNVNLPPGLPPMPPVPPGMPPMPPGFRPPPRMVTPQPVRPPIGSV